MRNHNTQQGTYMDQHSRFTRSFFFVATTSFTLEPPTTQTPERACVFAITKHGTVAIDLATVPPRTSFFHFTRDPSIGVNVRP